MTDRPQVDIGSVKLLIADVDGVLTDGSIYKGPEGLEFKRFSVTDGAGMALARAVGLKIALISGRYSAATKTRADELKIVDLYNGTLNKLPPFRELKRKYGLKNQEVAYIGDDLIDLIVMERVGVPIAVRNAHSLVKDIAVYTTQASGGEGAFREAIEWILHKQGQYEEALSLLKRKLIDFKNE